MGQTREGLDSLSLGFWGFPLQGWWGGGGGGGVRASELSCVPVMFWMGCLSCVPLKSSQSGLEALAQNLHAEAQPGRSVHPAS